jgi:exopolyphosphatase / guanosine-5'-triphosphate,3'-diphosphate pyrophosphatase
MNQPGNSDTAGRIAVIDLGSNSLRLVVFERLGGTLFPLLNEKVMCGLARGMSGTGRLNPEGMALALVNLRRFVALARAIGVDHLAVLATAAVRDASNGKAFATELERECRVKVDIIGGAEEARLSALGVLAGIPDADGLVGDLGGGSIELIPVGPATGGRGAIGGGVTLPLGPLRLAELGSARAVSERVEWALAGAAPLRAAGGRNLYFVGGAARTIARLHMEHTHYPLHVIHQYTIGRGEAEGFLDIIARQSRKSLERITAVSRRRLETVQLAAAILHKTVAAAAPQKVVFSAFGLREGYAWGRIPAAERGPDPLIAACAAIADSQSRFHADGDRLQAWIAPIFPGLGEARRRLHRAASWLSDIAWSEHPDYRAERAFNRALTVPFAAVSHPERVFVANALHARYGGLADDPIKLATRPLLDDRAADEVRSLGLAMRLAYTLCGGTIELLSSAWLGRDGGELVLDAPDSALFDGETVQRRLDAVARSLGLVAAIRRRDAWRAAGG